jgi:hypothetical protein
VFEILGMVGVVLQVQNTAFRMLPNPTTFTWDTKAFSLRTLLVEYASALRERRSTDMLLKDAPEINMILEAADSIETRLSEWQQGLLALPVTKDGVTTSYPPDVLAALHSGIRGCDDYLKQDERIALVQHVVRVHVQEVLDTLNPVDNSDDNGAPANGREEHHPKDATNAANPKKSRDYKGRKAVLLEFDSATAEERHHLALKLYVSMLRPKVVQTVCKELDVEMRRQRRPSVGSGTTNDAPAAKQVNDIWCMLLFRMICWLLLHDFHKKDIQVSKSDVFQSRMPVYIT